MSEELKQQQFEQLRAELKQLEHCMESCEPEYQTAFYAIRAFCIAAMHSHRASRPEAESEMPAKTPVCSVCRGSGVVDDGEIDCYSNGIPFENGPLKCVKDCPACVAGNAARDDARDAERYRYLRDVIYVEIDLPHYRGEIDDGEIDEAIDAAIKASKQGGDAP